MTISATDTSVQYTGDGTDAVLSTVFTYFADGDVVVTQRITATGVEATMVKGTHYSIAGGSTTGAVGNVTVITGATNFTTAMTWTIKRAVPLTQSTDYVENDRFPAASHETALDRATMQAQDVDSRRSITAPVTDLTSISLELPSSVDRASKLMSFDASGAASVATPTTVGYGKVRLAIKIASTDTTLTLTAEDWPSTYNSVELEFCGLLADAVSAKLEIRPIDTGVVQTTNMSIMESRNVAGTVTTPTGTDWMLDFATSTGTDDRMNGSVIFTNNNGFLNGHGQFTYRSTTNHVHTIVSYQRHTTIGAQWDGFTVHFDGVSTIASGEVRLWGIPRT